jgi:uncharacterized lipoprotein YbaY
MEARVMKRTTNRRTVLIAAGAAMLATTAGTVAAQSTDIHGEVSFKGGLAIPEGRIEIYLEDLSIQDRALRRVAETSVESDGGSTAIGFSISRPASAAASPKLQIVARLERADGWLVARGSARSDASSPVFVALKEAIY